MTELLAYGQEIRNILPFISDFDISYIIISTEFNTLLDHSISSQILSSESKILCLKVTENNEQVNFDVHFPKSWSNIGQNGLPASAFMSYTLCLKKKEDIDISYTEIVQHVDYMTGREIKVDFDIKTNISKEEQTKYQNSIKTFALKELYNEHADYIKEIIDKAYMYNDSYYDGLVEAFSGLGKTPQEIKRLIFGNYVELSDNEKRPLSKLTSDLLDQIGIK